jgi:hypothetical protein
MNFSGTPHAFHTVLKFNCAQNHIDRHANPRFEISLSTEHVLRSIVSCTVFVYVSTNVDARFQTCPGDLFNVQRSHLLHARARDLDGKEEKRKEQDRRRCIHASSHCMNEPGSFETIDVNYRKEKGFVPAAKVETITSSDSKHLQPPAIPLKFS